MNSIEMIMDVLTDEPQKQSDICKKLWFKGFRINERQLRTYFRQINDNYILGDGDYVVISNKHGTYKSNSADDIRKYNESKVRHAKSELYSAYNVNKRLSKKSDVSLMEYLGEVMNE